MKQKKFFFLAAAAMLMAACSENDVVETQSPQVVAENGEVSFDVYTSRTTTRAGWNGGDVSSTGLKTIAADDDLGKSGFGVFGYYTNSSTYDQQSIPNFFYNQQVKWTGNYFEYTPVKFWPNEYGKTAESEDQDKVTFFAYAPWVLVSPSTGKVVNAEGDAFNQEESAKLQKWGINSVTTNSKMGDPLVRYIASFDQDKSVDLCWGVCDDINWLTVVDGKIQSSEALKKGYPWIDVKRPADPTKLDATTGQKVKFNFKHATAKLMVNINAFIDGVDETNKFSDVKSTETKVWVRSVTFEGFATKGALNLNNTEVGANKAYWMDWNGNNDIATGEAITIFDGRKDGKEGTPSGEATNEKSLGLNPALIQFDTPINDGVTNTLVPLFRKQTASAPVTFGAADGPVYVIPTGDPIKVTITYDVETKDKNLATYISDAKTHGSSIENVITKDINFGADTELENGKYYVINLHLGLNSVKFDAEVKGWDDAPETDVDLPANVPAFSSVANGDISTKVVIVSVPASLTSYQYAITGLNGGETVTATTAGAAMVGITSNPANSAGIAIETATLNANNTTKRVPNAGSATVKGADKGLAVLFNQLPAPLGMALDHWGGSHEDFYLKCATGLDGATVWDSGCTPSDADHIKLKKNGTELTIGTDFNFAQDSGFGYITLVTDRAKAHTGDVYEIYVQSGDANAETIFVKCP